MSRKARIGTGQENKAGTRLARGWGDVSQPNEERKVREISGYGNQVR